MAENKNELFAHYSTKQAGAVLEVGSKVFFLKKNIYVVIIILQTDPSVVPRGNLSSTHSGTGGINRKEVQKVRNTNFKLQKIYLSNCVGPLLT